jgi:hypothetical protein
LLAEVIKDRDERLHQALERLEQSDAEAAQLLRGLVHELEGLQGSRYLDSGVTEGFTTVADRLYQMFRDGILEQFIQAANRLPDY